MIAVNSLDLRIGDRVLVDNASFFVQGGEFVAILGANGAGKTTLLRTLAGIRQAHGGAIVYGDRDLRAMTPAERAATIAHLTGDDVFFDKLCVEDVVSMGRYSHHAWWDWRRGPADETAVESAMDATGVRAFASRAFDTLSSGERQRVWIALALAQQAPVLLLDEPTSHLDIAAARSILQLLRSLCAAGKTVVCALHDLNEAAAYADRIILIGSGRMLACDTPDRVLTSRLTAQAYGVPLETLRAADGSLRVFPA